MTKLQRVYRELRKTVSREDARYAAPRLIEAAKGNWKDRMNEAAGVKFIR